MLSTWFKRPLWIVLPALAAAGFTCAGDLDATDVLGRVQAWLAETHDLEARFEQTLVSGAFGAGVEESGRLFLERPGRMRWDYTDPEVKIALLDGDRTWLFLEEERQLWEGRLDEAESLLPALMAGDKPLDSLFIASLVPSPELRRGSYRLRLAPRDASESFEEVVLTLRAPRFALEEVEVLDPTGNRMRYRFTELQRNRGLPAAAFRFEAPAGTEIVATGGSESDP